MCTPPRLRQYLPGILLVLLLSFQSIGKAQQVVLSQIQQKEQQEAKQSDVEALIGFSQIIVQDRARLENLRKDSSQLEPVFQEKAIQFNHVDHQLDSARNTQISPEQLVMITHEWQLLKEVLDFLLERRRSMHQQIKILERKLDKEQETIDFLMKGETANMWEITEQRQKDSENLPSDAVNIPDTIVLDHTVDFQQTDLNKYNWRIVAAERELEIWKAKFEVARKKWALTEQLLALNQDDLAIVQSLAESTDNQLAQWKETLKSLEGELKTLQAADSAIQLQGVIQNRMNETENLMAWVENALSAEAAVINNLSSHIDRLSSIKEPLSEEVAEATRQVESKNRWLNYLRSPLAPHRIYSFLVNTGPRILLIILVLFLVWVGGRWLIHQILKGVIQYKSEEERKERIETLSRALRSGLTVVVLFAGFMILLSELGIDVSVLLGGAAVFSLAIAFGAQSLIKDYFSGFMILAENQYSVGNVVKINQVSGFVEDISLRSTILRDLEGVAHFIPHSEITVVSNLTHGWSRVLLDIRVDYRENVDHVMEVILEVARRMREDPEYKHLIIGEPEMLGVDAFADSAVMVKLLMKTRPVKQWIVKRELLRRLKNRFDELGIAIPFPHRIIYHKTVQEPNGEQQDNQKTDEPLEQDVS